MPIPLGGNVSEPRVASTLGKKRFEIINPVRVAYT
jgi:hypothetical protein